jgi:hypothetical protein
MEAIKEPASGSARPRLGPIGQFAVKTAIVSAAIMWCGLIAFDYLDDMISRRMEQLEVALRPVATIGGKQFWTKLEEELDKQADPRADLSSEKKQKILSQIKIVADRWRPFLMEASSAITGDSTPSGR